MSRNDKRVNEGDRLRLQHFVQRWWPKSNVYWSGPILILSFGYTKITIYTRDSLIKTVAGLAIGLEQKWRIEGGKA